MAQKRNKNQTDLIAGAALSLAAASGWEKVTFATLSKKLRLKPFAITRLFPDMASIIAHILDNVEKEAEKAVQGYLGNGWRDNLMEIMMARFDIAARERKAFEALPRYLRKRPQMLLSLLPHFHEKMERMLDLSRFPDHPLRPVAGIILGGIYATLIETWAADDSRDNSKTMAAIDRRLSLFEKAVSLGR